MTTIEAGRETSTGRVGWPLIIVLLTLVPIAGVFTRSNIFYVRDLSFFFWSRHLWLRHTILNGTPPWWDPHVAAGQSAIADALNQILMPITLAIRLIPSDVISFNLWVALPLPLAALGMFAFLQEHHRPAAAALGAIAFGLSGVVVSMLNTPNLSWSVAFTPWVFWGTDRLAARPGVRRMAALAVIVALQALAGEPVTCAATCFVALAYAIADPCAGASRGDAASRGWPPRAVWTAVALCAGALLAAPQLVPTMAAGIRAQRGTMAAPDFWSLHPLAAIEIVAPHLFGNYYDSFLADIPWMTVLNSGRDPFFYSLYLGPIVLLFAAAGAIVHPRRGVFWLTVAILFGVAAMGGYTPAYPFVRGVIRPLTYFRFPVKYLTICTFALAALTADGWTALADRANAPSLGRLAKWAGIVAVAIAALVMAAATADDTSWNLARALAARLTITDPRAAADFLMRVAPPLGGRVAGLLLAGAALLAVAASDRPRARTAAWLLFAALTIDLGITNADLNLSAPAAKFSPPDWYSRLASPQRVYIGGRVRGFMNTKDLDAAQSWKVPAESTAVEGRMELNAEIPLAPSGWDIREALSYDLPVLWPIDYESAVRTFERATRAERDAFLRRSGVRWCVMPKGSAGTPIVEVAHWDMQLVECNAAATRVFVTSTPAFGGDKEWERAALFDPALPDDTLRLASPGRLAGTPGSPVTSAVRLVEDGTNSVTIDVGLPRESYVVLRDSFDPSWRADVDGSAAEIVRANGLYRAVRLAPGHHVIRFHYRPRDLDLGLTIAAMTAFVLVLSVAIGSRRKPAARQGGFTLVELMIVMAILGIILAIAFARYHGMTAKGNEASAMASLRSIAAAEWSFAQTCGKQKYATTLSALGQPVPSTGEGFLSPDLTAADVVQKSGYQFQIVAKPMEDVGPACNGVPVAAGYAAMADPLQPGSSGDRFFAVNADRVLYEDAQTFVDTIGESGAPGHGTEVK